MSTARPLRPRNSAKEKRLIRATVKATEHSRQARSISDDSEATDEDERWRWKTRTLILREPESSEEFLRQQLTYSFVNLGIQRSWFTHVPACIGKSKALDSAASAVIGAWRYRATGNDFALKIGNRYYGEALQELRASLDNSDLTLMAVALLANFEDVLVPEESSIFAHAQGLSAIIRSRSKDHPFSDVARAIFYPSADVLFHLACSLGISHPLDEPQYRDSTPPLSNVTNPSIQPLRLIFFKLYVRLPRLVKKVRICQQRLRAGLAPKFESALAIATELLSIRDDVSETKLLHHVRVIKTASPATKALMPFSFDFASFMEMTALAFYWETRLLLVSLTLIILNLPISPSDDTPDFQQTVAHAAQSSLFDTKQLEDERERYVANIIMTWQYALPSPALKRALMQALLFMWGAVSGMGEFRKQSTESVRQWLLLQASIVSEGTNEIVATEEFMNKNCTVWFGELGGGEEEVHPLDERMRFCYSSLSCGP